MPKDEIEIHKRVTIDFEPVGRRIEVQPETDLLTAALDAGVQLMSICGGIGSCDSCVVRTVAGTFTPPTLEEEGALDEAELSDGYRLACQTKVLTDAKVDIPAGSLTHAQRLQVEGHEAPVELAPAVVPVDVSLQPPTLKDLRSDASRLLDALGKKGVSQSALDHSILTELSSQLRDLGWSARVAWSGGRVVAILPPGSALLGLAIDIGTTKLAAYLVDLATGKTIAKLGAMNPQIGHGEDVISRIAYADQHDDGRAVLQRMLVETINEMVAKMCAVAGLSQQQIVDAVVVGNTAMHHLFAGLPVHQLGVAPYVPAVSDPLDIPARSLGLNLAPSANVHLPPVIAGYVGADHVSMLLAAGVHHAGKAMLAIDIGTNTEVTLATGERLLCCSCASGPAFEGAHIRDGMRASPGAIERVQIIGDKVRIRTVGQESPVGICGSGILDAVAEMHAAGILDANGGMKVGHPLVRGEGKQARVVLAEAGGRVHGREIAVNRVDVNEVQLAKGAIRAGIEILLSEAGISFGEVDQVIVAGAFGTYLTTKSAVSVGMFPNLPQRRFRQVGNAAGIGAKQMLVSTALRHEAVALARRIEYVDLTTNLRFTEEFMKQMHL